MLQRTELNQNKLVEVESRLNMTIIDVNNESKQRVHTAYITNGWTSSSFSSAILAYRSAIGTMT